MLTTLQLLDRTLSSLDAFDRLTRGFDAERVGGGAAPVNIFEGERAVIVQLSAPGVKKEDLEINVEDDVLTVSGARAAALPEGYTALHRERRAGRFSRSFALSRDLDAGAAEARLEDGVLTLTLPRRVVSRRSIPVQAA